MVQLTRYDDVEFVVLTYRELLTAASPGMMKREIHLLASENGQYVKCFAREQGVETIDCRRAQFSDKEPIIRLRMICQSWKVMFQAEYSSGQPLRMLVDLRASVEAALGSGSCDAASAPGKAALRGAAAAAGAGPTGSTSQPNTASHASHGEVTENKFAVTQNDAPEFNISAQEWNPDEDAPSGSKK